MSHLDDLNEKYPVRRTAQEKTAFRKYITHYIADKGMDVKTVETKNGENKNVIVGDPLTADVIFTAHYDTPGMSLFPNIMIPRNKFLFFAYQFLPILTLLFFSIAATLIGGVITVLIKGYMEESLIFILFLVTYYLFFYLMFFAFKNPKNYNDNNSGVETLLEIIDRLTAQQQRKIAFIFFDNEEKGKKGSKAYFNAHKNQLED